MYLEATWLGLMRGLGWDELPASLPNLLKVKQIVFCISMLL